MRQQLIGSGCSLVGVAFLSGFAACSSNASHANPPGHDAGHSNDAAPVTDAGCKANAVGATYVLIDDMETTDHGPIQLQAGITSPLTAGYWYNSGASYFPDAGLDMSTPPQGAFMFTSIPTPTKTLDCRPSAHAARQSCVLNGLYDTCGVGFEFAQKPDGDAGAPPSNTGAGGAGDAGPSVPRTTIPFDISRYKAITFWGMTTRPDSSGSLQVKVSFPDTDTDPRGQVCNGGGGNTSKCYNSYASVLGFTSSWQQFTVVLNAGDGGVPPSNGISIDPSWGYQQAQWLPTQVYGINWQAQRNIAPDAGAPLMTDIWVDDVYFVE